MATVTLAGSEPLFPFGATGSEPVDGNVELKVSVAIRCGSALGITVEDYAAGLINGTIVDKLNNADFEAMFAPTQADIAAVSQFAVANGLTVHRVYTNSATIKLTGCVRNFNQAFGITLQNIVMPDRVYMSYIRESISIPEELDGIILAVFGLDNTVELERATSPSVGSTVMTPTQLASLYNFPVTGGLGQCVGVIEFGGGYTTNNLTGTFAQAGITPTPNVIGVPAGGNNSPDNYSFSQEVMLDIYVVGGVIPQGTTAVYFGQNTQLTSFYNAISTAVFDTTNNPSVISISWGADELAWGAGLRTAIDSLFARAIVKGITVVVSTGDYGSRSYANSPNYTVQYPAVSPYVLACGGTVVTDSNLATEVVWNQGNASSAGGLSRLYPVPAWQTGLTAKQYPSGSVGGITGRAIPDVSGHAVGYQYYYGYSGASQYGIYQSNGVGTSAVAPLYAGLIARLNAVIQGRCGFVNSFFYTNPSAFNDIVRGNNAAPAAVGYAATSGWDACTGLGSPNGVNILKATVSQPAPVVRPVVYPTNTFGPRPTSGQVYPRVKLSQTQ